ncbi:MAG: hypothetical protein AB1657_02090 [Candidatus Micrarchaeota archaeon]
MEENRDFIAGLLNFFVWGLGYLYTGKYLLGAMWITAFILTHLPAFYLGLEFYLSSVAGTSMFMGHLAISVILLYQGLRHEARSAKCWRCVEQNWPVFLAGTIVAGVLSEAANEFLVERWWVYHPPWTLFGMFGTAVGLPLVGGWFLIITVALLFSYILTEHTKIRFFPAWIISWILVGFIVETFNSLVWRTWHYQENTIWTALPVPGLDYGLLVPIVGYGATGVFTYLGYIVLEKLLNSFRAV